ncbi:MAG: helix-hairpin-helix domain-containing protein, partial [Ktedonobacterales bacterium]
MPQKTPKSQTPPTSPDGAQDGAGAPHASADAMDAVDAHADTGAQPVDKGQVAAIFDEMANLLELDGANQFEVRAYQNASRAVGALEGDLGEIARSGRLATVPGIGKTMVERINELLTSGHMKHHDELLARIPDGLRQMLRIPGVGPKRVRQISQALDITTLDQLREAAEQGKIATLPGFGAKSQENILKGLEFLASHADKHRYDVAEAQASAVADALRALPQVVRLQIGGSLRRHKEIIKDIDIVASVARDEDRAPIMDTLVGLPSVISVTGKGDTKTSVVLQAGIALDLRVVLDDEYPYALHHFTGSKEHNVALRTRFHPRGVKINEYGIFRGEERIPCADEHDIYRALGMAYVEPELREERGEI